MAETGRGGQANFSKRGTTQFSQILPVSQGFSSWWSPFWPTKRKLKESTWRNIPLWACLKVSDRQNSVVSFDFLWFPLKSQGWPWTKDTHTMVTHQAALDKTWPEDPDGNYRPIWATDLRTGAQWGPFWFCSLLCSPLWFSVLVSST